MKNAKDIFMYALGALVTLCFFAVLAMLIYVPMPPENKDMLLMALGALIGFEGAIISYFYGSSKSSAVKDETISDMLNKPTP